MNIRKENFSWEKFNREIDTDDLMTFELSGYYWITREEYKSQETYSKFLGKNPYLDSLYFIASCKEKRRPICSKKFVSAVSDKPSPSVIKKAWNIYKGLPEDKKIEFKEEAVSILAKSYKIHLMIHPSYIISIVKKIIKWFKNNRIWRKSVQTFKIKIEPKKYDVKGKVFPIIVIYVESQSDDDLINILDMLMKALKNLKGLNKTPRYNKKITSWLYIAGGDGDAKTAIEQSKSLQNRDIFERNLYFYKGHVPIGLSDPTKGRILNKELDKFNIKEKYIGNLEDNYDIDEKIGEGAFGKVFKSNSLALKILPLTQTNYQLILNSYKAIDTLENFFDSPKEKCKYLTCYDKDFYITEYEGNPYILIVMNFIKGISLQKVIDKKTKMYLKTMKKIMKNLLKALNYIHEKNVVHRDIKPDNIIYRFSKVILTDFDSACVDECETDVITNLYVSPEQLKQGFDSTNIQSWKKADIWALGIVFYQLVFKRFPYKNIKSKKVFDDIENFNPNSIIYPDKKIERIIRECLMTNPDERKNTEELLKII